MFSINFITLDIIFLCILSTRICAEDAAAATTAAAGAAASTAAGPLKCYMTETLNPKKPEGSQECKPGEKCVRYTTFKKDKKILMDSIKCGTKAACEEKAKTDKTNNTAIDSYQCRDCAKNMCMPGGSIIVKALSFMTILSPLSILYIFSLY
ncbi:hypothetical protein WA026_001157 [Henosepilachna vigintioctopunctata]|uniref:Uncharacterized protein n=1 Tax=Henosepilachna vigintioctopunctata TaxID=420089 RepID=A0AAW1V1I5_9CUCU